MTSISTRPSRLIGLAVRTCTYLDGRCHRAATSMVSTTALIRLSPVSLRKNGREPQ